MRGRGVDTVRAPSVDSPMERRNDPTAPAAPAAPQLPSRADGDAGRRAPHFMEAR
jgi:hypothetical protein